MPSLETEIAILEAKRDALKQAIQNLNPVPASILQQIQQLETDISNKRAELTAQKHETIYQHMARTVGYSKELKECIEKTVNNLLDPNAGDSSIPGLLLGRIQSGKTRAYVGVMALAFDKGFDACIVLTKSDNGLVSQTKTRMESEFKDYSDTSNTDPARIVTVFDVNESTSLSTLQRSYKNIFVLHKNTARLKAMKKILDSSYVHKKVLVIDDEADYVSRTFYAKQGTIKGGAIGFKIDELTSNPLIDFYYLQVTATAYSLLLQPDGTIEVSNGTMSCFKPRFTVLVPSHSGYIGGEEYFVKSHNPASMYSFLHHPISDDCFNRLYKKNENKTVTNGAATNKYYADLRDSLMSFFVGSAIRQLQEQKRRQLYRTCFLLHCSTQKADHSFEKKIVSIILNAWQKDAIKSGGKLLYPDFQRMYSDLTASITAGIQNKELEKTLSIPSVGDTFDKVIELLSQGFYVIQCFNGDTADNPNLFDNNGQLKLTNLLNIFIGGFKADRGITVDNMIGFMYGRRPQDGGSANMLLQHMRQFGNRNKSDLAVTRFHTTNALFQRLSEVHSMDEVLRESFKHDSTPQTVLIQYDDSTSTYKLCSPSQIRMSAIQGFEKFGRIIATPGFQTKDRNTINPIIQSIEAVLSAQGQPGQPFLMSKDKICQIIGQVKNTFEYQRGSNLSWDTDVMIGAIEKYTPKDGKIWCYFTTARNLSRMKANNTKYNDAPDTAQADTPIASRTATDRPFFMLIKENGDKSKGWNDAPFYWPVLRLPHQMTPSVYCSGVANEPRTYSSISVTLNNGNVIQGRRICDTLIECINSAGASRVESLNIKYRNNNLVFSAGRKPKDYEVIEPRKYYIRKGIPARKAKEILETISSALSLGWTINLS